MPTTYKPDTYYRFNGFAPNWLATSGVMNYCEENGCHWVLDTLASYAPTMAKRQGLDYLLVVEVRRTDGQGGIFTIKQETHDGNSHGEEIVVRQDFDYTSLKRNLKFWAINESMDGKHDPSAKTIVMLPEEY